MHRLRVRKHSIHSSKGNILYGIEVFIHPGYRGLRLARRMYEYRKSFAKH